MQRRRTGSVLASIILALIAIPSRSQNAIGAGPVYVLSERATYESGCFPPCACPILQAPLRGTFRLTPVGFDGLFNNFVVTDVNWAVNTGGTERLIGGSGQYKLGGEVALVQQLDLDLIIADNPVQHFSSGLVAAGTVEFPGIDVAVSKNHMFCYDTAIVVDAAPAPGIPAVQRWAVLALGLLILIVTTDPMLRRRKNH